MTALRKTRGRDEYLPEGSVSAQAAVVQIWREPVTQRSKEVMQAYRSGLNDDTPDGRACRAVADWLAAKELVA